MDRGLGRFVTTDTLAGTMFSPRSLQTHRDNQGAPVKRLDAYGNASPAPVWVGLQIAESFASTAILAFKGPKREGRVTGRSDPPACHQCRNRRRGRPGGRWGAARGEGNGRLQE